MNEYILPLILTLGAGMSTLIGGLVTFFIRRNNLKALSVGLGFSAGVMVYVSLSELMKEAPEMLLAYYGEIQAKSLAFAGFFLGIIIAIAIDYFIPDHIESDFLNKSCSKTYLILSFRIFILESTSSPGLNGFFKDIVILAKTISIPIACKSAKLVPVLFKNSFLVNSK